MIKAATKLGTTGPGRMAIPDLEDLGTAAPGSCRRYTPAKRSPSVRATHLDVAHTPCCRAWAHPH